MNQRTLAVIYVMAFLFAIIYDKFVALRFFPTAESFLFGFLIFLSGFLYLTSNESRKTKAKLRTK